MLSLITRLVLGLYGNRNHYLVVKKIVVIIHIFLTLIVKLEKISLS